MVAGPVRCRRLSTSLYCTVSMQRRRERVRVLKEGILCSQSLRRFVDSSAVPVQIYLTKRLFEDCGPPRRHVRAVDCSSHPHSLDLPFEMFLFRGHAAESDDAAWALLNSQNVTGCDGTTQATIQSGRFSEELRTTGGWPIADAVRSSTIE